MAKQNWLLKVFYSSAMVLFFLSACFIPARADVIINVMPTSTSLAFDQPIAAAYIFTETNGQNIQITTSTATFLSAAGAVLATMSVPAAFSIPGFSQIQFNDRVYMPSSIKNQITNGWFIYRRTIYGTADDGSSIAASADITVRITSGLGAQFSVTKTTLDSPISGTMFKNNDYFCAHAFIEGTGSGMLEGYWCIDDMPLDYFSADMTNGVTVQTLTRNKLFTSDYGAHNLYIKIVTPNPIASNTIFYTVSEKSSAVPILKQPRDRANFKKNAPPPDFVWTAVSNCAGYKIAIAKAGGDIENSQWIYVEANHWAPAQDYWNKLDEGVYFWAVKSVDISKQLSPASDANLFSIIR